MMFELRSEHAFTIVFGDLGKILRECNGQKAIQFSIKDK